LKLLVDITEQERTFFLMTTCKYSNIIETSIFCMVWLERVVERMDWWTQ